MAKPNKKNAPKSTNKPQPSNHRPHVGDKRRGMGRKTESAVTALPYSRRNSFFLFGRHAVKAAILNKKRECLQLFATEKTMDEARALISAREAISHIPLTISSAASDRFALSVGNDSPHQGLILEVAPLPSADLYGLSPMTGQKNIILMLDQVTDPQNVGACLRSAAAFGARAVITQDRNSPSETGSLARASQGGLEMVPWVRTSNLSTALDALKDMGYWHVGLDGDSDTSIRDVDMGDNIVLVMGSEGKGLRPLVTKHCDMTAKITMSDRVESLNISNAAAIALYELSNI